MPIDLDVFKCIRIEQQGAEETMKKERHTRKLSRCHATGSVAIRRAIGPIRLEELENLPWCEKISALSPGDRANCLPDFQ